ncbi:hypothetical protein RND81_08G147600 [Saponaria officinalis]|uniref:MIP18 family-like domain-containing protein n=1 Tax=Saponaria officinalis TaxID=3572 RepID=A0AAW1J6M1_SAPOF
MVSGIINQNPTVYVKKNRLSRPRPPDLIDEYAVEPIDKLEIFDHIRDIMDPEHPYSLEQLNVVTEDSIEVDDKRSHVRLTFTPTVEHCAMARHIGLCLRIKLLRSLPSHYNVDIRIAPGTHVNEAAVNKRVNDKERIAASLENSHVMYMVDECLAPSYA